MSKDQDQRRSRSVTIHAVIDRIEDNEMAVILLGDDEKEKIDLPVSFLPAGVSDGDHLRIQITLDEESRAAAENRIRKLQDELEQKSGTKGKKNFKL